MLDKIGTAPAETKGRRIAMLQELTFKRAAELLSYDRRTGVLRWRLARGGELPGAIAGTANGQGYVVITVDRRRYKAHRVAWLLVTGEWPAVEVDHRDRDRSNNAWANLRLASKAQNMMNSPGKSKLGLPKGVRRILPTGKFRAEIYIDRKRVHLGTFKCAHEAAEAYRLSALHHFGEFALI